MVAPTLRERSALAKQLRLDVAQLTDVGRKREHNEDNMAFVIPKDPLVMANKGALFIVADGMGGHAAGEVASEIAVDTVSNMYYQDDSADVAVSLLRAIRRANASIHQRAAENMLRTGMGTTCVAAVLRGNIAYIANVGDSRAYLLRGSQVKQISQDHSWVAEQVRAGLLTEDQARTHAQRNVITRCLGTQAEVDVDVFHEELNEGDSLVLCTDGLSGLVSDEELLRIVDQFVPQESVYHLVERANENGGPDNITAIVARVQEVGEEPPGVRYPVGVGGREKGEDTVILGMYSDAPLGVSTNGEERIPSAPLRLSSGPLISSPDSITAPQPALVKPQSGRGRLFYPTIALIALLIITLTGGGVFYFLRVNESQTVNQALDTTQQQMNQVQVNDPTSALKTLSTAQKTLVDVQSNHRLDGAQMQRVTDLQDQLVSQVNKAIFTYNHNANICVLNYSSNPIDTASTHTSPQSIAFAQNTKGAPFLYTLALDNRVYEINNQNSQYGMISALPPGTSPMFLSLASNGSLLFLVEKQVNSYFLRVFQPGAQGELGTPGASTLIDSTFTNGGYVPAFTTAWGTNVYVVLSSPSDQGNARIASYVLDPKGHLSTPKKTNISISAPIVSIAAFPDQLFLLLSTGDVQSTPLVNGSQPSTLPTPVLAQPPIALPLATNANGFTIGDPVPTVTTVTLNNQKGSAAPLSVPSASPVSTAMLTAGQVNHTPHLYIGDPVNYRVLDLEAASGLQVSPSPAPTGTNVAASSVKLQLVQQYVSSAGLSQVKSLAADPQGNKLAVLLQKPLSMASLVSISTGTPPSCV
jgi:serine/threonine protein phosphatase PrpC